MRSIETCWYKECASDPWWYFAEIKQLATSSRISSWVNVALILKLENWWCSYTFRDESFVCYIPYNLLPPFSRFTLFIEIARLLTDWFASRNVFVPAITGIQFSHRESLSFTRSAGLILYSCSLMRSYITQIERVWLSLSLSLSLSPSDDESLAQYAWRTPVLYHETPIPLPCSLSLGCAQCTTTTKSSETSMF